jgi:hypothetical protein
MKVSHGLAHARGWLLLAVLLHCGEVLAQCNVSASIINIPGESYSPLALETKASGGIRGNTVSVEMFNSGQPYVQRSSGSIGEVTQRIGLGCGFDASGQWTWKVSAVCVNFDPSLPSDGQPKNTFANISGGPFVVTWTAPEMHAEILNPPDPLGNVKITWSFPRSVGEGRAISIDGGKLGLNSPPSEGEFIFKLSAGKHTLAQRWCIESNGNAKSNGFDILVPPAEAPSDPGTFRFDVPSTENVRVLTHRYGDDSDPPIFGDNYPSRQQTQDGAIKVEGVVTDATGRPLSGKTVYLRLTDPPDPSSYIPSSDRVVGDNIDGSGGLNGRAATANVFSDAQGRVTVTLNTTDHVGGDNYQLEASMKSDFSCGAAGCAKSAVYTAWKRIYVEVDKMFKRGSFIRENVDPGATSIKVTDITSLPSPPFEMRLIHAARIDAPAEFYGEMIVIARIVREPDPARQLRSAGVLLLNPGSAVTQKYFRGQSLGAGPVDYLADAAGVVTGNRSTDYVLPIATLMPRVFDRAFVEHVWLTDATTTDHPDLLDSQVSIAFDGVVPFERVVNKAGMEMEAEFLFKRWARNVRRAGDLRAALPNHHILITMAKHALDRNGGGFRGLTEAGAGRNHTFVFDASISGTNMRAEVLVHELTHQWRVNNGGQGHCDLTGRRQHQRMFDHSGLFCTMTSHVYDLPEGADGTVGFHYTKTNGIVDSEFMFIRERAEPVPQDTPYQP